MSPSSKPSSRSLSTLITATTSPIRRTGTASSDCVDSMRGAHEARLAAHVVGQHVLAVLGHPAHDAGTERHAVRLRHHAGGGAGRAVQHRDPRLGRRPGRWRRCSSRTSAARSARSRPAARCTSSVEAAISEAAESRASWPERRPSTSRARALPTASAARCASVASGPSSGSSHSEGRTTTSPTWRCGACVPTSARCQTPSAISSRRRYGWPSRRNVPTAWPPSAGGVPRASSARSAVGGGDARLLAFDHHQDRVAAAEGRRLPRQQHQDVVERLVLSQRTVDLPAACALRPGGAATARPAARCRWPGPACRPRRRAAAGRRARTRARRSCPPASRPSRVRARTAARTRPCARPAGAWRRAPWRRRRCRPRPPAPRPRARCPGKPRRG